ncbi:dirigent protein 22-like [Apium graveolens]|uniref:dirigent protein 22-like n=1 Tax=Apium graveolens TaxID=4045 RepID=UPI003D78BE97
MPKSSTFIVIFIYSLLIITANSRKVSRKSPKKHPKYNSQRQKLSHLHFYYHDRITGKNPTSFQVASASVTNKSATYFGSVAVMDDPLTVGPNPTSKQVGRAQGIYSAASRNEIGLLMVVSYVFTQGKFNGSTISVLGRNAILSAIREMPIVGGSGVFRFARGYAQARTHTFDLKSGDAVVEYNVYVFHY